MQQERDQRNIEQHGDEADTKGLSGEVVEQGNLPTEIEC
jgi:hypothetical protein